MIRFEIIRFILASFLLLLISVAAQAQVTDLSKNKIEIRYSFEGAELILFGTTGKLNISGDYDVVVVVRGPQVPTVVRKKDKKFGIWMNDEALTFAEAPGYYAVASSRPLQAIASAQEFEKYGIGFNNLKLTLTQKKYDKQTIDQFKKALFRGRMKKDLYREGQDPVLLVGEGLYRTNIYIPANVPVGDFHVQAYIFQNGQMVGMSDRPMTVSKEGFERAVYDYAHTSPFLYGLTAVIIALFAGWLAASVGLRKS